jgi:hypothetical protein
MICGVTQLEDDAELGLKLNTAKLNKPAFSGLPGLKLNLKITENM